MSEPFTIAGVQIDVQLGDKDRNLERICASTQTAARQGARLIVFPECVATGYCFNSLADARACAETIPGPGTNQVARVCRDLDVFVIFGTLETAGDDVFNACALVGPSGWIATHRKAHMPFFGVDRFATPGDKPFAVHDLGFVRVGMSICYDGGFPETSRVLALKGADLIVLATNFSEAAHCMADHVIPTRALENNVYYAAVNRVGTEGSFAFIGKSKVCDPHGIVRAEAPHAEEAIIHARIDPEKARQKRIVCVPGRHEMDRFADRRPDLYGEIVSDIQGSADARE